VIGGMIQTNSFSAVLCIMNAFVHKHSSLLAAKKEAFIIFCVFCNNFVLWSAQKVISMKII